MAVLKTSFRFPEINLGFVTSARGTGHLTPKKSLGGHLTKERSRLVGNLTKMNKKCQMPGGQPGGAWAPLDLTHTLGADISQKFVG